MVGINVVISASRPRRGRITVMAVWLMKKTTSVGSAQGCHTILLMMAGDWLDDPNMVVTGNECNNNGLDAGRLVSGTSQMSIFPSDVATANHRPLPT